MADTAPHQWLTPRLLARPPQEEDRDAYRALFREPAVERWLRPEPLPPFEDFELDDMLIADRRHWEEHGFGPWLLTGREGGATLGRGGLQWTELDGERTVELPWTIGPAHWNRGLATEAARAALEWAVSLGLERVVALVLPENVASRRVAEKAGMRLEGEAQHAGFAHCRYRLSMKE